MVNIISGIALIGVTVGTTALVVVLSIFNGFDTLIKSFFSVFDAEIRITAAEGKQFDPNDSLFASLKNDPSLAYFCEVAEEIAHFRFEERQTIARIKGVSEEYLDMTGLDMHLYDGKLLLNDGNFDYTILGRGLAYNLGAATNFVSPVYISVPRKGKSSSIMMNPFRQKHVFVSGIYSVGQQEVDAEYALIPLELARELLDMGNKVSALELGFKPGSDLKKIQKNLQKQLGSAYKVENRYQQHESYYRVAESERFFIYLTLSFILIIASFNLASSIAMLLLDKRKDIRILSGLGLTRTRIGRIFMIEGWLVTLLGLAIGIVLGLLICWGQIYFGWLKFPGSFAIENYPVEIRWSNLVIITLTVLTIGGLASWLPLKLMPARFFQADE